MADPIRVVTISVEELERRIEDAVRRALEGAPRSEWLTPDQAAELLGVARSSLKVLVRRDGLPTHRAGRSYRFKRGEVETWLEGRASQPGGHSRRHGATLLRVRGSRGQGG